MKDIMEIAGATLTLLLFALIAWLFLAATPDQCSAEADLLHAAGSQLEGNAK